VRDGNAGERCGVAGGDAGIGGTGFGQRDLCVEGDKGIQRWIVRLDALQVVLRQLEAGGFLSPHARRRVVPGLR